MHRQEITLSEKEKQLVQRIADERGISWEEAADQLVSEGLEKRVRRGVRRAPAKVYDISRKKT